MAHCHGREACQLISDSLITGPITWSSNQRPVGFGCVISTIPSISPVPPEHRLTWSVMIPTYNCEATIEATMRSAADQLSSRSDVQIVVVDDGSTDRTVEIAKSLAASYPETLTVRTNPSNLGHHATFARCIQQAVGLYVHLLHGDDQVEPGFYDAGEVGFADASVGAVVTGAVYIDQNGEVLDRVEPIQHTTGIVANAAVVLASEQRIMTPSIAVRRSVYEELGAFDSRLRFAEDWEMWVRIASRHNIWFDSRLLARYRIHGQSNSGTANRSGLTARYNLKAIRLASRHLTPSERSEAIPQARSRYAERATEEAIALLRNRPLAAFRTLIWAVALARGPSPFVTVVKRALSTVGRTKPVDQSVG